VGPRHRAAPKHFDQRIEVWVKRVRSARIGDAYYCAAVVQGRVYTRIHARGPTERAQVDELVVMVLVVLMLDLLGRQSERKRQCKESRDCRH